MNQREYNVERSKLDVKQAESKLREAQKDFEYIYKKMQADLDREYNKLKECVERAKLDLDREKTFLKMAESELEKPFEND